MLNISKAIQIIVLVKICISEAAMFSSNVWENGDHFEGDMVLQAAQEEMVRAANLGRPSHVERVTERWPDNTVRYTVNKNHFNPKQINIIRSAMRDIEANTCILFKPAKNNEHAVLIEGREAGCFSHVGYNDDSAQQRLNLGAACLTRGNIQHQLLHALGMFHTQSARDRDDHVTIKWENVQKGKLRYFGKYTDHQELGVPYDSESLMHFSETAFSTNGFETIKPVKVNKLGQNNGMSKIDILTINKMYNC